MVYVQGGEDILFPMIFTSVIFRTSYYYIDGRALGENNWTTYGFRELDDNNSPFNISDLSLAR